MEDLQQLFIGPCALASNMLGGTEMSEPLIKAIPNVYMGASQQSVNPALVSTDHPLT